MEFIKRCKCCHVSGYIYRKGNPSVKYAKNSQMPLSERVPKEEQAFDDWEEYDPDEEYGHY